LIYLKKYKKIIKFTQERTLTNKKDLDFMKEMSGEVYLFFT